MLDGKLQAVKELVLVVASTVEQTVSAAWVETEALVAEHVTSEINLRSSVEELTADKAALQVITIRHCCV